MKKVRNQKYKIGISIGDVNGIGLEVILKTLEDQRICELCTPILYGNKKIVQESAKRLGIQNLQLDYIKNINQVKSKNPSVIELETAIPTLEFGKSSKASGAYAAASLRKCLEDLKAGNIDAMVTAPIDKHSIQSDVFNFPGHTEYLQAADESEDSLMIMMGEHSKIGLVTGHIPLSEVSKQISEEGILKKVSLLNKSLKEDFQIRKPKIAVLGLNPHAGDNGLLGKEEEKIIQPAINQAKSIGILCFGPYPADGFFGSEQFRKFDGVIAMYHDQGLIPAKSLSFGGGVNVTAGLSFIRTSPDHGTAYGIAGQGIANEGSFRNALYEAISIAKNRDLYAEINAEPLSVTKNRS